MALYDVAVGTLARWRTNAVAFVREGLGVERFEAGQRECLDALVHANQVAFKGSKGTGKTTCESWAVWWYLTTRPHANVAITSVSGDNLRDGLAKELGKWYQRSPILQATFDLQQTRITNRDFPATWWASFRTWSKTANAQEQSAALAGLHADSMLFVIDEAGSVPRAIVVTAQAALTSGPDCKLLLGGNPVSLDSPLHDAEVAHAHYWRTISVSHRMQLGDPDLVFEARQGGLRGQRVAVDGVAPQQELVDRVVRGPIGVVRIRMAAGDSEDALGQQIRKRVPHFPGLTILDETAGQAVDQSVARVRGLEQDRAASLREKGERRLASPTVNVELT